MACAAGHRRPAASPAFGERLGLAASAEGSRPCPVLLGVIPGRWVSPVRGIRAGPPQAGCVLGSEARFWCCQPVVVPLVEPFAADFTSLKRRVRSGEAARTVVGQLCSGGRPGRAHRTFEFAWGEKLGGRETLPGEEMGSTGGRHGTDTRTGPGVWSMADSSGRRTQVPRAGRDPRGESNSTGRGAWERCGGLAVGDHAPGFSVRRWRPRNTQTGEALFRSCSAVKSSPIFKLIISIRICHLASLE